MCAVVLLVLGCKNEPKHPLGHEGDWYYTCSMHPSVVSNSPGSCPICNMSLIKVQKKLQSHTQQVGNVVRLSTRQQMLAGIKTDAAQLRTIMPFGKILGTVVIDEEQLLTISSRVKGRIDKLFVKTSGEYVHKGSPLYAIYSEQLLADQKEFVALSEKQKQNTVGNQFLADMLMASRNRLSLWGLTEKQLSALEELKNPSSLLTFYSPSEGYVLEVNVKEGVYVDEGALLIKMAQLKQVWVAAQVYTSEKPSKAKFFQVFSIAKPNEVYNARLVFDNPTVEAGRKVHLLRLRVDNVNGKLIPGTMVYVSQQENRKPVLSVQKSAVLLEKMKTIWVMTDQNTFEQRMVTTGIENQQFIEILSGLQHGEQVVTDGSYLISSEFILKSGTENRHSH